MTELAATLPWAFIIAIAATITAIALAIANHIEHAKAVHKLQLDVLAIRREYAQRIQDLHREAIEDAGGFTASRTGSAQPTPPAAMNIGESNASAVSQHAKAA